jgi:hypothetical protein
MIITFDKYKLIKESPDTIWDNDTKYYCEDKEALPFFMMVNSDHTKVENIFFGVYGGFHSSVEYYDYRRSQMSYPGRLWTKSKIITFWCYPNAELFKSIVSAIEEKLNIKMLHTGWKIEVFKVGGEIRRKEYDPNDDDYFYSGGFSGETELIPIEQYAGSDDVPEEQQIMHMMNWKEKELAKKFGKIHFPKGFGSDKTGWDSPHNIKWRQALRTENKKY